MAAPVTAPDYIVVGAGSAGCIVAARLALAGHRVTLVEAGPRDLNPLIHVPAGVRYLISNPGVTWADTTEADGDVVKRHIAMPHGRVIGGSGSINGMIFVRGLRSDFDAWAEAGAHGWDFEGVLPHFRSLETFVGGGGDHRGTSGPLRVARPRTILPLTGAFLAAAVQAGHRPLDDINQPDAEGVGLSQMNRRGRFRGSSARTFLAPARRSGNLEIVTSATVERLLIEGNRCAGVQIRRSGETSELRAERETIVTAGAIGSPELLQRSGVGPAEHLRRFGITVRANLPGVGANLIDHYAARVAFRVRGARTLNDLSRMPRLGLEIANWCTLGGGILTTGVTTAILFARSGAAFSAPDLQLLFAPLSFDRNRFGALEALPGCSVTVSGARPRSRGSVLITGPDPRERPAIRPNYLAESADLQVLLDGIAATRAIFAQPALADHIVAETLPGDGCDLEQLRDHVRQTGVSIYHPVGTCRMGADRMAVVDPELRVHGIADLRVADASIMPSITSGNTNAPTMMIGEKAAALILGRDGRQAAAG